MTWRRSLTGALCLVLVVGACGGAADSDANDAADPGGAATLSVAAEIVQLRRDEALGRVQVALENTGREEVVVEAIRLRVPGFRSPGAVPKDSPVPAGRVVNLPTAYGEVRCNAGFRPRVGRPEVTVRLHTASEPGPQTVTVTPRDPQRLLRRIADGACTARRLAGEVDLRFGQEWRPERTPDGTVMHGTIVARLLVEESRTITQVAGTVMYGVTPDDAEGPVPDPLARLTPARREASIPVRVVAARCDGHTIGEIKKPFAFLVWVGARGKEPVAVTPQVDEVSIGAFKQVCSF